MHSPKKFDNKLKTFKEEYLKCVLEIKNIYSFGQKIPKFLMINT